MTMSRWKTLEDESVDLAARGDFARAIEVGHEAMQACESALGAASFEHARCTLVVAVAHHYRSLHGGPRADAETALSLATQAHAIGERAVGPDDPRMAEL